MQEASKRRKINLLSLSFVSKLISKKYLIKNFQHPTNNSNLFYQRKQTLQYHTGLFFCIEESLKISNISQDRDHFGQILQLPTNNSKSSHQCKHNLQHH